MVNQRNVSKATAKSKQGAGRDASEQKIKLLKVNVELNEKERLLQNSVDYLHPAILHRH